MSVNKHTVLRTWVQPFVINAYLNFESVDMMPSARSLVPNYGDFQIKKDICGNKYKEYTFAFVGVQSFDTGTSSVNEDNMKMFDDFNDWIETQETQKNYPNFGENVTNYKLIPLQNMANLSFYDEETQTAKYMLMVRVEYMEKGE